MTPTVSTQRVIPGMAWAIAGIAAGLTFIGMMLFLSDGRAPAPLGIFLPFFMAAILGAYILLVGYVYGDARMRGMRYAMWTWLAILIPNGIGIILYFILREPKPVYCSRCGSAMSPGFAYCPRCGTGMSPACSQCHRVAQSGWTHCPYCGANL
jgi:RNA polymerase subunit RPABC4/transcription elongation factor Spt4